MPAGKGRWELFDLESDPGEQDDLADAMPAKVAELVSAWEIYAEDVQMVLPTSSSLRSRPADNSLSGR
jgi:arylsulfatase